MRASALVLALVVLLLAPPVHAQDKPVAPPADAAQVTAGNYTATYWVLPAGPLDAGSNATLLVSVQGNGTAIGSYDAIANGTLLHFHGAPVVATPSDPNATSVLVSLPFTVDVTAVGNQSYTFTLHVGPGTDQTLLEGAGTIEARALVAPPAGVPRAWLWGGAAVLLVAVAVGAYQVRDRRLRRRMQGEVRSRALREQRLEEMARKRPEDAAAIHQEIRQEEQVREKRREVQILEAKRADVEKQLDLLRKRHEAGQLSKHQFDTMAGKRHAELVRLDEELAAFEREG